MRRLVVVVVVVVAGCTHMASVTTDPAGATVVERGKPVGQTPYVFTDGQDTTHMVTLQKEGFLPRTETVRSVSLKPSWLAFMGGTDAPKSSFILTSDADVSHRQTAAAEAAARLQAFYLSQPEGPYIASVRVLCSTMKPWRATDPVFLQVSVKDEWHSLAAQVKLQHVQRMVQPWQTEAAAIRCDGYTDPASCVSSLHPTPIDLLDLVGNNVGGMGADGRIVVDRASRQ